MDPNTLTVVTGGGRGIGRAIALRMARETAVLVVGRTAADLAATCDAIEASGGVAHAFVGDVTDPAAAARASALFADREVRNLVLNAGIGKSGLLHEMDDALWESIMATNVLGARRFAKAFLPAMLERKRGTVVLMSSLSGLVGSKLNTAYVASKHALVGLAKGMAQDYGKDGIVTVALCPGYVETEMTERSIAKRMGMYGLSRDEALSRIVRTNPQHRIIPAEEIAEMAAFVCSGKVPSLSGAAIPLTGGA